MSGTEGQEPGELEYVYAVGRPGLVLPGGLHGVAGSPVRLVAGDGVVAVVGTVPAADFDEAPLRARLEDLAWLERTARDHQHVVAAVAGAGDALPLRLATVCRDEDGVRRMLTAGRERFAAAFAVVEGREEWGVKAHTEPAPAPAGAVDPPAGGAGGNGAGGGGRPVSGRDYLRRQRERRQVREVASREAETWAREAHRALSAAAERSRLHRPQDARLSGASGQNVLNGAYLVSREAADAFAAQVRELAGRAPGLRVELTGPWPAYSFADAAGPAPDGSRESAEAGVPGE
ncbi:GvpL/GvpF family gas vesicle protein [Streptomyces sp. TRM 70351]|uniref:GvpL/GvpF family gas vesicle protein n=1 Tax=Streptomyces sp. TRM 70351 TaxID=3116552 RepID=UPI002E7AD6EB|nr:GvpL/GvpF family gas vesicle protein [Streptomyces sp. TRM 70351]MEE1928260.1 GvpL/GvpF family gas vesicle protein [Streptomyces sp. TRM 70351]